MALSALDDLCTTVARLRGTIERKREVKRWRTFLSLSLRRGKLLGEANEGTEGRERKRGRRSFLLFSLGRSPFLSLSLFSTERKRRRREWQQRKYPPPLLSRIGERERGDNSLSSSLGTEERKRWGRREREGDISLKTTRASPKQ